VRFIGRNAIALVALVFAMTGTGIAASHYIITSTSQIKPSVLKKLRGKIGATGRAGVAGPVGAQGLAGTAGERGIAGPAGKDGAPGEEGPPGEEGAPGEEGQEGEAGTSVVAHVRSVGAVDTVTEPQWATDALTGSSWEQGPDELDQLVGQIDVTIPSRVEGEPNCSAGSGGSAGTAHIDVLLDGSPVATVVAHKAEPSKGSRVVYPIEWSTPAGGAWLYEPGEVASHTLSVEAQDDCGTGEGFATARFTINSSPSMWSACTEGASDERASVLEALPVGSSGPRRRDTRRRLWCRH
jgi:hypothetical protein